MLSRFGIPRLSYAQLFSFQVLYSNNADSQGYANSGTFGFLGRKKGDWKRAILEVDFTMGTLFLQDKDRIIMSESFEDYKRYKVQEEFSDDALVSVRFKSGQWEIMAQNAVEKYTLQHLLECMVHDMGAQEAAESGIAKGLVGVDKEIMNYGPVHRRAKTAYKKDERFLVVVPGKLLLFKGVDIAGKHVRFVTSLFGATTRLVYGQLEFEVIVPDSKSLNLLTPSAEALTGWIGAIEKSSLFANEGPGHSGRKNLQGARARDPASDNQGYIGRSKSEPSSRDARREDFGAVMHEGFHTNRSKDYDRGDQRPHNREYWNQERERDHRNQVYDGYAGSCTESKAFGENSQQDNGMRAMEKAVEFGQTDQSNMQLPRRSLQHAKERDQKNNGRQYDHKLNGVSSQQELPETSNQSAKPMQTPRKAYPDQRAMDNPQLNVGCLNGEADKHTCSESRGGQECGVTFGRHEERNAGKGVAYYAQFNRGNAGCLPGSTRETKPRDGNYAPPVEANEECCMSKSTNCSCSLSASASGPLNQQWPGHMNPRNPTDLISNRRGSKEELAKMIFYMNLYRRGLIDSSTQT